MRESLIRQAALEGTRAAEAHERRDVASAAWHAETLTRIVNAAPAEDRAAIRAAFNDAYRLERTGS